jgi:hypothetical protein
MDDHMPMDISHFPLSLATMDTEMWNFTGESIAGSASTGVTATSNGSRPGIRTRENITPSHTDSDERPSKRARPLNSGNSSMSPFDMSKGSGLTNAQQIQCTILLNTLCKMPAAQPFLEPVNPVDAKAPDYFQVITQPMDLGTIGKKLKLREGQHGKLRAYSTLQEFVDDVELVFSNCFKYNTPNHAVSQLAKQVKEEFEKGMARIPEGEVSGLTLDRKSQRLNAWKSGVDIQACPCHARRCGCLARRTKRWKSTEASTYVPSQKVLAGCICSTQST